MPSLEVENGGIIPSIQGDDQSKPMSGPIIGIIYPPPEVRSILLTYVVLLNLTYILVYILIFLNHENYFS